MIRLRDTRFTTTSAFLSSAIKTAEYYGFQPIESFAKKQNKFDSAQDLDIRFARKDERTLPTVAKRCLGVVSPEHPVILGWRTTNVAGSVPSTSLELHIVGASSAVAEALLIMAAHAIAEDAGVKERILAVNSIGSTDSSNRYVRDVGAYLRKHLDTISPTLRPRAATDPLGTLVQLIERGHPAVPRAPQAMEYLTDEERGKLWDLLEYLETHSIPYELNPHILGSRECWSHSLFEISSIDSESHARVPFAFGGRYDALASRIVRAPAYAAMVSISCEARGDASYKHFEHPAPTLYFAYIGAEARRRSLGIIEALRRADIEIKQGIYHEKIGEQMAAAQSSGVPYILIMGHKEAMDGTVIVREVSTNAQEAVPVSDLPGYIKRHRMHVAKVAVHA
jgi:histidyl-tRNA synthetase